MELSDGISVGNVLGFQELGLDNTVLGLLEDELDGGSLGKLVGDERSVVDGIWLGT